MRVEDAEQVKPIGLDPLKGVELLIGIHHESHRTLSLILYEKNPLHPVIFPRQQTARLQRRVEICVIHDRLSLFSGKCQLMDHFTE